jgi:Nickel/cobalt transporter regulator
VKSSKRAKEINMNFLIGAAIALALLAGSASAQEFNDSHGKLPPVPHAASAADPYQHIQFAVNDWRQRNLTAPPRGYHWVGNDSNRYLLVSIDNGIVLDECNQSDHRRRSQ